jgi:serine protease Do
MNPRTQTIASFFTVAMAAMLVGAFVTTQIRKPHAAEARAPEPSTQAAQASRAEDIGLNTFRDIARRYTQGVVNISAPRVVKRRGVPFRDFFGDDLMERFFGPSVPDRQSSLGSGFVVDKDGYILTNRHVVDGADQIFVTLPGDTIPDGKRYEAKLVGKDARTDVALLKIEPKEPLTVLDLGDSDGLEVGEWVMAIGNPFGLGGNSVTVGVVSFKGRPQSLGVRGTVVEMIQTDAAINPGNSGGPLLDTTGRVVGINTMIVTEGARQSAGVGFSVPINVAREILPQLREKGRVVRGWLGVGINPVTEELARTLNLKAPRGAIVAEVTPGSPAEKAGVKPEDVIVRADDREIDDNSDLTRYIASRAPGTTVKLTVLRERTEKQIAVTLGTFQDEPTEAESAEGRPAARLGMALRDLTPAMAERMGLPRATRGALVVEVEPGEAADEAGLAQGDVIVSVNGETVEGVDEFERLIGEARKDGVARLRVRDRNGYRFAVLKLS